MAQQPDQLARVRVAVVLVLEHYIFERDAPRIIGAGIVGAGLEQLLDPVFLVDRDDLVADLLGHRVQRDGEIDPDFRACARHHRHHARSAERDPTLAEAEPIAVHHDLQRIAHALEIIQRLAHPHHHDVGQHAPLGLARPFTERITGEHDLPDDLVDREVADQSHRAGVAEAAIEGAADLARDAQGSAIGVGDEHHLEIVIVVGPQQPLAGAVNGHLRLDHAGAGDPEPLGQPGLLDLGDVGHDRKIGRAAIVDPVEQLLGAQLGCTRLEPGSLERSADAVARQADQLDARVRVRRRGTGHGHGVDRAGDRHQGSIGAH